MPASPTINSQLLATCTCTTCAKLRLSGTSGMYGPGVRTCTPPQHEHGRTNERGLEWRIADSAGEDVVAWTTASLIDTAPQAGETLEVRVQVKVVVREQR